MKSRRTMLLTAVLATASLSSPQAWEAATTHAGLAEIAALGSTLHQRISSDLGVGGGLFSRLIIPPADARPTFELLGRFNPTHGYVPDKRGRLTALAWLAAGAAIADSAGLAAHHFLDPQTGSGLDARTLDFVVAKVRHRLRSRNSGGVPDRGTAATQWLVSSENPLGLLGFVDQYSKSVSARTAGERERHLAGALLAAGAIVHVVQDMASPSHVRVDLAAHLDRIGTSEFDVGSRLERIAELAYGRLGVPDSAGKAPAAKTLLELIHNPRGDGLADIVAARYWSRYTLPAPIRLPLGASTSAAHAQAIAAFGDESLRVELGTSGDTSSRIVTPDGTCIATFDVRGRDLSFATDDECVLAQLEHLLPLAATYGTAVLDHLFRGTLTVGTDGRVALGSDLELTSGRLTLFSDDARGVRTSYFQADVKSSLPSQLPAPPAKARRITALLVGAAPSGEPFVAVGSFAR